MVTKDKFARWFDKKIYNQNSNLFYFHFSLYTWVICRYYVRIQSERDN